MAAGVYAMNWRLSAERGRLLRRGRRRPAAGPLLVAGGRGAVLPRVAAAAARGRVVRAPPRAGGAHGGCSPRCSASSWPSRSPTPSTAPPRRRSRRTSRARDARLGARAGGLLALALLERRLGRRAPRAPRRGREPGRSRPPRWSLDAGSADAGRARAAAGARRVALLAAGTSAAPPLPTRALTTRPARFVGRISYAWYIWHWPALVFAAAALGPALGGGGRRRHTRLAGARARHAPLDRGAAAALEGAPAPAARDPGRGDRRPGRRRAVGRRAVGERRIAAGAVRGRGRGRRPARPHRARSRSRRRRCARAPWTRATIAASPYATAASSSERATARRAASTAPGGSRRPSCCSATRTRCSCSRRSSRSRCAAAGGS